MLRLLEMPKACVKPKARGPNMAIYSFFCAPREFQRSINVFKMSMFCFKPSVDHKQHLLEQLLYLTNDSFPPVGGAAWVQK